MDSLDEITTCLTCLPKDGYSNNKEKNEEAKAQEHYWNQFIEKSNDMINFDDNFVRIRDRPMNNRNTSMSDTLYIRGISRTVKNIDLIRDVLCSIEAPIEIDFSTRTESNKLAGIGGQIWVKYASIEIAHKTLKRIHNFYYHGVYLSVIYEFGLDPVTKKRIVSNTIHHKTIIRRINKRNNNNKVNICNKYDYSSNSIVVNNMDYPYPTGVYMTRWVQYLSAHQKKLISRFNIYAKQSTHTKDINTMNTCIENENDEQLLIEMLTNTSLFSCNGKGASNKYAKEMTEAMSMVDNIERGLKHCNLYTEVIPMSTMETPESVLNNTMDSIADEVKGDQEEVADTKSDLQLDTEVHVYVLGDGMYPICAALIALYFPYPNWCYYSIDPILEPIQFHGLGKGIGQESNESCGNVIDDTSVNLASSITPDRNAPLCNNNASTHNRLGARFHQFCGYSQDFVIPRHTNADVDPSKLKKYVSIVVACHSHAPLQEFWDRIQNEANDHSIYKLAISMNCCSDYCMLYQQSNVGVIESEKKMKKKLKKKNDKKSFIEPAIEFDDYEVYSPKRKIRIYMNAVE